MKINLLMGSDNVLSDAINIDPLATNAAMIGPNQQFEAGPHKYALQLTNLDSVCDDSEVDEIVANGVSEYLGVELLGALNNWVKKLRRGGRLIVSGVDFYCLAKSYSSFYINEELAQNLLYSNPATPWQTKKNIMTSEIMQQLLTERGLKINKCRVSNMEFLVEAVK